MGLAEAQCVLMNTIDTDEVLNLVQTCVAPAAGLARLKLPQPTTSCLGLGFVLL